jgi:hypothetical protein
MTNKPALPFIWSDTNVSQPALFYRVQAGP